MEDPSNAKARTFIARIDTAIAPVLATSVVPIYAGQNDKPVQCGTGTLFRISDTSLLVTAAHVTEIMTKYHLQLYISDGTQGAPAIPLEGMLHVERRLDVAVWRLGDDIVNKLKNRRFLTVQHADRLNVRTTAGWFYIHGYPNCWSTPSTDDNRIVTKPLTYGTVLYDGRTDTFGGYDPSLHVLLEVPKSGNVDSNGDISTLPESLEGISGSSIWQAYEGGTPSVDWRVDDAVVIAVQTGTFKAGTVVKGTRWFLVEAMISKNYHELSKALEIVTPHRRTTIK